MTLLNSQKLSAARAVLRPHDVDSLTYLSVLIYLYETAPAHTSMGDLAQVINIRASGLTLPISRLYRRGLVGRGKVGADKRVVSVWLTDKGRDVARLLTEIFTCDSNPN